MQEQILFSNSAIKVTNAKLELSGKMYPIAHIAAVKTTKQEPETGKASAWYILGILLTVISVFGAASNAADIPTRILQTAEFNLFIAAPIIGISRFLISRKQTIFTIKITMSSGETESIDSTDIQTIQSIKNAIDLAITSKGTFLIKDSGEVDDRKKVLN
jgi:hypothetical protein